MRTRHCVILSESSENLLFVVGFSCWWECVADYLCQASLGSCGKLLTVGSRAAKLLGNADGAGKKLRWMKNDAILAFTRRLALSDVNFAFLIEFLSDFCHSKADFVFSSFIWGKFCLSCPFYWTVFWLTQRISCWISSLYHFPKQILTFSAHFGKNLAFLALSEGHSVNSKRILLFPAHFGVKFTFPSDFWSEFCNFPIILVGKLNFPGSPGQAKAQISSFPFSAGRFGQADGLFAWLWEQCAGDLLQVPEKLMLPPPNKAK